MLKGRHPLNIPDMTAKKNLPYHLRSPRLRWAYLAITLETEELSMLHQIAANPDRAERVRSNARLLMYLHHRVPISDICDRLNIDRRTLLRVGTDLIRARSRHQLHLVA